MASTAQWAAGIARANCVPGAACHDIGGDDTGAVCHLQQPTHRCDWFLFLVANLSTVTYALINRSDLGLAACFTGNALCSAAILLITYSKRRSHGRRNHNCDRSLRPAFERI